MPMFYIRRDIDTVTWFHFYRIFAPFLIIAATCYTYENLPAALICMVGMPVIAASRFKSHIKNSTL